MRISNDKVNHISKLIIIDLEKIDHLGFAGRGTGFDQFFAVQKRIDERRFAHIGTPREGEFR